MAAASGALSLTNSTFSGELPQPPERGSAAGRRSGQGQAPQDGGGRSFGGGSFDVDSFTVLGIDPEESAVGPLASVEVSDGRALDSG